MRCSKKYATVAYSRACIKINYKYKLTRYTKVVNSKTVPILCQYFKTFIFINFLLYRIRTRPSYFYEEWSCFALELMYRALLNILNIKIFMFKFRNHLNVLYSRYSFRKYAVYKHKPLAFSPDFYSTASLHRWYHN